LTLAHNPSVMKGLAAVSWGDGRIDLFRIADDGALWHDPWVNGEWLPSESLGGQPASRPAVVSWAPNEMQVFVIGRNRHLWNIYWDGTAWHHWVDMGRPEFGNYAEVAASTWGANRIDVWVGDEVVLWHRWWDGAQWVDWQR